MKSCLNFSNYRFCNRQITYTFTYIVIRSLIAINYLLVLVHYRETTLPQMDWASSSLSKLCMCLVAMGIESICRHNIAPVRSTSRVYLLSHHL